MRFWSILKRKKSEKIIGNGGQNKKLVIYSTIGVFAKMPAECTFVRRCDIWRRKELPYLQAAATHPE